MEEETKGLDWSKVGLERGDMSTNMFEYVSMLDRQYLAWRLTFSSSALTKFVQRPSYIRRLASFPFWTLVRVS
jgi:hypothetical protein